MPFPNNRTNLLSNPQKSNPLPQPSQRKAGTEDSFKVWSIRLAKQILPQKIHLRKYVINVFWSVRKPELPPVPCNNHPRLFQGSPSDYWHKGSAGRPTSCSFCIPDCLHATERSANDYPQFSADTHKCSLSFPLPYSSTDADRWLPCLRNSNNYRCPYSRAVADLPHIPLFSYYTLIPQHYNLTLFISSWATKSCPGFCHVRIFTYLSVAKRKQAKL